FMREHNRLAAQIQAASPTATDEDIYQAARLLVGAEIEVITYKEWIPALLGANALPAYGGYTTNVNSGIADEFSTASFRLGHSMLRNDVRFLANDGHPIRDDVELRDAFTNPALISQNGIDPVLKYLATDNSSEVDTKVVDGLRNFLFTPSGGTGGLDL